MNRTCPHRRDAINCEACNGRGYDTRSGGRYGGRAAYNAALHDAEKDRNGIVVDGSLDFGIIAVEESEVGVTRKATIKAAVPSSRNVRVDVKLASELTRSRRGFSAFRVDVDKRALAYGNPIVLSVKLRSRYAGRYHDLLEIHFDDPQSRQRFVIVRPLRATVGSKSDHELLKPSAPYVRRQRPERQPEIEVLPGVPPPSLKVIPWVVPLPDACIPEAVCQALDVGPREVGHLRRTFMPKILNGSSYAKHFKNLLWFEEHRMDRDLELYDIPDAMLTSYEPYYYLPVPGLAEKRPSVLVGDRILVQKHGDPRGQWYEGHVHVVRQEEVGLRFHHSFGGWAKQQRYTVHFKLNRFPVRRQHQALDTAYTPERILFPLEIHTDGLVAPPTADSRLRTFNKLIADNIPQLQAVLTILKQKPGGVPIVVFGPPGTGKTVTIIEAIRQILYRNGNACILACAPSNSAADLIAQRLIDLTPDELFRFYAPSRDKRQVPDDLRRYTATSGVHFSVPPIARMKRFKVIVTTCVSAGMPHGVGMPRGHFTHIFVDEAGQATEPEVMIPIKTMADETTNIVFSGDHKQLGPIVRSHVARQLGLDTSYLERLMKRDAYDLRKAYGISVIKLVKNFRSHNAILKFPNERFYAGELQQYGDPKTIDAYLGSSILVSKTFPIIFHAISGQDVREASSPSFFNIDEITLVKDYVQRLRADRHVRITDHDIGIITPYHAQCQKMRTRLRSVADDVKVGSVEEFQGQERRVIIISTVRSSREFVEYDLKHTLGFVANPRRFNVAVTRAKALLIVVGDPNVLSLDPLWRSFLNYVHDNSGWRGEPIGWDPSAPIEQGGYDQAIREQHLTDMNEFTRRMEELALAEVKPNDKDEVDETEANVDRPWRDVE